MRQRGPIALLSVGLASAFALFAVLGERPESSVALEPVPFASEVEAASDDRAAAELVRPEAPARPPVDEVPPSSGREPVSLAKQLRSAGRAPSQREEWRVVFTAEPHQEQPFAVRLEHESQLPVNALSQPVKGTRKHVVFVRLTRAAARAATISVASSREALEARDGRPVRLTKITSQWGIGFAEATTGRRSESLRTLEGLGVQLKALIPLGDLMIEPQGLPPMSVLAWTSPVEGQPHHALVADVPAGAPVPFGSFVPAERWYVDAAPADPNVRSLGVAFGGTGQRAQILLRVELR